MPDQAAAGFVFQMVSRQIWWDHQFQDTEITFPLNLSKIRNIGIAAHIDAGKTTVLLRSSLHRQSMMARCMKAPPSWRDRQEEYSRGITINSAATTCPWTRNGENYTINLIDTPGHVDFTAESIPQKVLDGAVAVFDGKEGVEAQSETVWRQATKYNVPRVCFVNKMDKMGADFDFSFNSILERLGAPAVAVQIPIGQSSTFEGIIDLIRGVAIYYNLKDEKDKGKTMIEKPIPEDENERVQKWRHILEEKAADLYDNLTEKFLNGQPLTEQEIRRAAGTHRVHGYPVFCGSALKYVGVQRLLDGVIDYLPSPMDLTTFKGHDVKDQDKIIERHSNPDEPFCGLAFKIVSDQHGDLTYVRICSGRLEKAAARCSTARVPRGEHPAHVPDARRRGLQPDRRRRGRRHRRVHRRPGEALTGDTLCDPDNPIEPGETDVS